MLLFVCVLVLSQTTYVNSVSSFYSAWATIQPGTDAIFSFSPGTYILSAPLAPIDLTTTPSAIRLLANGSYGKLFKSFRVSEA